MLYPVKGKVQEGNNFIAGAMEAAAEDASIPEISL